MTNIYQHIQQFFIDFFYILNEMSPYLLLGLFFAGLLKVYLPEKFISKYLRKSNAKSAVNATLLGIPLPLCSCGVLPTGISLYKNGASKGATNAFITSTPQTGVDSILVTYAMLGLPMAIIRVTVALISGVLSGIATNLFTKKENRVKVTVEKKTISCATEVKASGFSRIAEVFRYAFLTFLSDIARWLVIGILVAAFISVLLPDAFFTNYISSGILGIALILVASMPLYICATASVPIAAVLMSKGISPGAILVFLMAGPATNVASFTLIGKTMGKKSLIAYLATIIGAAVGFGILIDTFLPREWFTIENLSHNHVHGGEQGWIFWLQTISTIILVGLILYIYIQKHIEKTKPMTHSKDSSIYKVPDVSCNHCKKSLEDAFSAFESVQEVNVNVPKKTLLIKGAITDETVEKIVKERGFTYEGRL
ncbi:hypothetical protein C7377_0830 [Balneicella halophila]|uniref:HMA domain-containing protein n=1 Tax=Balneicella halophila TaxID=1537566 RepID=A0A7L4UT67_BALHA|nr:permease [Balneicella halophila]PVX52507.1 hypothetical protein C7377_0830 [Balneicella halophila]